MNRSCASCGRELPPNSRESRRFCSTACRVRAWHDSNPAPDLDGPTYESIPLHWHLGHHASLLAGDWHAGHWRGPDECPPGCPGLKPPYTYAEAVPESREGLPPRRTVPSS